MTDAQCADVLTRVRARWHAEEGWQLTLEGQELQRIGQSSRYVHKLGDRPYVVKVDHGHSPAQSWHEWWFWNHTVKGSDLAHMFAPTRAISLQGYDHEYPGLTDSYRWVRVMSLQEHVNDGRPHVKPPQMVVADDVVRPILKRWRLADVCSRQCVYDAKRGHYVLVDYGITCDYYATGAVERERARQAIFEEVRTSEKVLVNPILTDSTQ